MKKVMMTILLILSGMSFVYWSHLFYSGRYKPIELKYLGSADGTGGISSYVAEQRRNFMYCGYGYDIFDFEMIDNWNLHDFDFNLELQESRKYIISIGVPIERLEYRDHYSRATYSKDKIQEGRFYFYEIDNIPITRWGELEFEWELTMVNANADRTLDKLNMFFIFFSLFGFISIGWHILYQKIENRSERKYNLLKKTMKILLKIILFLMLFYLVSFLYMFFVCG